MAISTYTAGSSSDLNRARRALNDTGGTAWTFSDAEINDWIADRGTWQGAVAEGYRCLAGRVARQAQDYTDANGVSVSQTANYDLLKQQADDWDARAAAAQAVSSTSTLPRAIVGTLGRAPSDPTYQRN